MANPIAVLFERLLPETLAPLLGEVLGPRLLPVGDAGLHRVCASGRFSGPQTADLLAFASSQDLDGALVVVEIDVQRALFFEHGHVIAAESSLLFERLGRILGREDVVDKDGMETMIAVEEQRGVAAAVDLLPPETARWALERRIWEVASALYFTRNAHFLVVEGEPNLGDVPTFHVDPMQLAMEGIRAYDEWRNTTSGTAPTTPSGTPPTKPEPVRITRPAEAGPTSAAPMPTGADAEALRAALNRVLAEG